jgi:hypothetical protein
MTIEYLRILMALAFFLFGQNEILLAIIHISSQVGMCRINGRCFVLLF